LPFDRPVSLAKNMLVSANAYFRGDGTAKNYELAEREFKKACEGGVASACSDIGYMYKVGDGVGRDDTKALGYLKKACDLGMTQACRWLKEQQRRAAE
jgi:TPR repeat protein